MTANGKSIGEVRAFVELKVKERSNVANAFSSTLKYTKLSKKVELKSMSGLFFCF